MLRNYLILLLTGVIISLVICFAAEHSKVVRYQQYYCFSEALLDSLEDNFNWQDRYDDACIDAYYDARRAL